MSLTNEAQVGAHVALPSAHHTRPHCRGRRQDSRETWPRGSNEETHGDPAASARSSLRTRRQGSVSTARHTRCDGREATPPRRVSSATFGGTALKDTFPLESVIVCSHGSCSCTSQPLVALPQTPFPGALQVGVNLHSDQKCHRRVKSGSGPSDVWWGSLQPGAQRCWDVVFLHSGQERAAPKASGKRDCPGGPPQEASSLGVRETSSCQEQGTEIQLLLWKAALALRG